MKHSAAMASALSALLLLAPSALADENVLFEVQGKDKILGTIRPADETEGIVCRLAKGTTLSAAVKSKDKAGPIPTIGVLLDGVPVPAAQVVTKGRGSALVPFAVDASGTYKLVIRGDGQLDGDYQAAVSWKPQKTFTGAGVSLGETTFDFAAPARSVVSVTLAPAPGSSFVPNLVSLRGPLGAFVAIPGGEKVGGIVLPSRGDWSVHFASMGPEGAYRIVVKVAAPAASKHQIDIRDSALSGAFSGGPDVVGSVFDPESGGSIEITDGGSPLAGTSVSVPAGSLGQSTSIFVAEAEPYTPPGGDLPAGPAVEFGPSGTQFDPAKPATVTIPFDPDAFPGGPGALVVYVKSANGTIEPVLPTSSYVFVGNTVTFTTSHFSTFQAATRGSRGLLSGDYEYVDIRGGATLFYGGLSGVASGAAFFNAQGFQMLAERAAVHFESGLEQGTAPSVSLDESSDDVTGRITQVNDTTFDILDDATSLPFGRVRRGLTDDVLVLEHEHGLLLRSALMLRRIEARPTLNALAGRWHVLVWEVAADLPAAGAATLPIFVTVETGDAVVTPTGSITFKMTGGLKRFVDYPGNGWNTETIGKRQAVGTLTIDPDFIPVLDFGDPEVTAGFLVGAGGDVLVAKTRNFDRGFGAADLETGLLVLVRESAGASAGDLSSTFVDVLAGLDLHTVPPDGAPETPLSAGFRTHSGENRFAAGGEFTSTFRECLAGYESQNPEPIASTTVITPVAPSKFTLTPSGIFSVPATGDRGAIRPGGGLVIYLRRSSPTLGLGFKIRMPASRP